MIWNACRRGLFVASQIGLKMKLPIRLYFLSLVLLLASFSVSASDKRIDDLTDGALRLCGKVNETREFKSEKTQVEIKGEVAGILKNLVPNISANALKEQQEEMSSGLAQDALSAVLKDTNACKLKAVELFSKVYLAGKRSTNDHSEWPNNCPRGTTAFVRNLNIDGAGGSGWVSKNEKNCADGVNIKNVEGDGIRMEQK